MYSTYIHTSEDIKVVTCNNRQATKMKEIFEKYNNYFFDLDSWSLKEIYFSNNNVF